MFKALCGLHVILFGQELLNAVLIWKNSVMQPIPREKKDVNLEVFFLLEGMI